MNPKPLPPVYLLPGMTQSYPIFQRLLPFLPTSIQVTYPTPAPGTSLSQFAKDLAHDILPGSWLVGVSFGGMVASEIASHNNLAGCILISTIQNPNELPIWARSLQKIPPKSREVLLERLSRIGCYAPSSALRFRCRKFMGANRTWNRWAISAVLGWAGTTSIANCPLLRIHGTQDATFPLGRLVDRDPIALIHGGGHCLPITHTEEIFALIQRFIKSPQWTDTVES